TIISTAPLSTGAFTITGAGTGAQTLIFSMSAYDTQRVPITLGPGDVLDVFPVKLALSRGTITGTALLAGMSNHSGIVVSHGSDVTVTAVDGNFTLAGLLVGTNFTLTLARPPDWAGASLNVASLASGQTAAAGSATLQPAATASIAGTASLEDGATPGGITVL